MPMNDVTAALIYSEHGNGKTTKHSKASITTPTLIATPPPPITTASSMTNSSKADIVAAGGATAAAQLGSMLAPNGLPLTSIQGQKWQQVFDLDKMIKQLRTAEKTHLRGGTGRGSGAGSSSSNETKQAAHVVQVQRLNAADMAYYDMVPKQATRDIVICNACSGSYTKAGFNNHIALQHPNIWDATSNKLSSSVESARSMATAEHSQEATELASSPTDTSLASCPNGSNGSTPLAVNNNAHASSSSTSATSSSSRHKSSSKSSSSSKTSSSSTGRSRSKSSKNRHHAESHHKPAGAGSKRSSANIAVAPPAPTVKDEPQTVAAAAPAAITVFSSSSNSSCSLPSTPLLVNVAGNANEHGNSYSPASASLQEDAQPSKKKQKAATSSTLEATSHHRSKSSKEKQTAPMYEQPQQQQLSELDQAVCSITEQQQQRQHQVNLATGTEEPLPMHNTSDDNSISLTLDDMLDSKFINEILNTVESDIPFDESALDTSQSQSQTQQQLLNDAAMPPTKRLRYDDGGLQDTTAYANTLYQQQQQQTYGDQHNHHHHHHHHMSAHIAASQSPNSSLSNPLSSLQSSIANTLNNNQQQQQQQLKQELNDQAAAQFNVYNVPSLTDDAVADNGNEHMMLPSIIYEFTANNQVSVLDQQSQNQAIAEFLNQAGYDHLDVNVLQAAAGEAQGGVGVGMANHFNEELCDFDFAKLETVSAEANHTKTVKLETQHQPTQQYRSRQFESTAQPHRQLSNAKHFEDSAYNMMFYAGPPRPLAMNTFNLVKLPNGMGATLRKNLLMTRKANSLLSLNGSSNGSVVGTLARTPPPAPSALNCNGNGNVAAAQQQQFQLPRGKTIYAQKCSIIAQERLRCNKRALVNRLVNNSNSNGNNVMTVKRLHELLSGKVKDKEKNLEHNDTGEQLQQEEQQSEQLKRTHSFYEKRRKLLSSPSQQRQSPLGSKRHMLRARPMHLSLQLQGGVAGVNAIGSASPQQQLLKKQLMRTLSDSGNNILGTGGSSVITNNGTNNPWKSNSSPGSTGSDLMRVLV
ncbi:serine-rich adhesin for platelets [Drosophila busckii]|uniref:serine-rich adhesin for platelets n=1 Tax=Drosophila busckii TaxID=30019 RepID=UPI001432D041|nr:serine-rich adhesin for platelets [Drosophila busckii]